MSNSARGTHRDALLDAARMLLRERGHASITARDLVAASGTNLGSIGYHFGSKDALLDEAAQLVFEEWTEAVGRTIAAPGDTAPLERLAAALRLAVDDVGELRPYFLAFVETVARSARSPEARGQVAAHYRKQRARVAEMVTAALGDALAPPEADRVGALIIATIDGLMLQALLDPEQLPSGDDLLRACAQAAAVALGRRP